jgi:uncharacterized protein (TIGR00369 family)
MTELEELIKKIPFLEHIKVEKVSIKEGYCEIWMPISYIHFQQNGFVHAGVQSTLADHACGVAAATIAPEGKTILSIEFKMNMLRPAVGDHLIAIAKIIKAGKTIVVTEAEVFTTKGNERKMVSKMQATMMVVDIPKKEN